jgi:acetyl-CoA carboxylase/biotin carboxylase 1
MIVDALSEYKSPVFVYLPPFAELRGGSWAVVDPLINRRGNMEMFSSESAQGGILEASGTAGIKFRKREQLAAMQRLDPVLHKLNAQKAAVDGQQQTDIDHAIEKRCEELSKGFMIRFFLFLVFFYFCAQFIMPLRFDFASCTTRRAECWKRG